MNADNPQTPREELEVKLTALLLGELPPVEAAALLELIRNDRELSALHEHLKQTLALVQETAGNPTEQTAPMPVPLKLSGDRREKLLAHFKTVTPKEFVPAKSKRRFQFTLLELTAVLAIAAILAAVMLPSLAKSKSRSQSVAMQSNLRQIEIAKQMWAQENGKSAGDAGPTIEELNAYLGRGEMGIPSIAGETYVPGKVGEPAAAEVAASQAPGVFHKRQISGEASERVRLSANGTAAYVPAQKLANEPLAFGNRKELAATTPAPVAPPPAFSGGIVLPAGETSRDLALGLDLANSGQAGSAGWNISSTLKGFYEDDVGRNDRGRSQDRLTVWGANGDAAANTADLLALNKETISQPISGNTTIDPATGLPVAEAGKLAGNGSLTTYNYGLTMGPSTPALQSADENRLETRVFKVDPNTFYRNVAGLDPSTPQVTKGGAWGGGGMGGGGGGNVVTADNRNEATQRATKQFFDSVGVKLDADGKDVYFNDRTGELIVRGTAKDMGVVEAASQVLNAAPPKTEVKAQFGEIADSDFTPAAGNAMTFSGREARQNSTVVADGLPHFKLAEPQLASGRGGGGGRGLAVATRDGTPPSQPNAGPADAAQLDYSARIPRVQASGSVTGNAADGVAPGSLDLYAFNGGKPAETDKTKVPALGDIPMMGHAFRTETLADAEGATKAGTLATDDSASFTLHDNAGKSAAPESATERLQRLKSVASSSKAAAEGRSPGLYLPATPAQAGQPIISVDNSGNLVAIGDGATLEQIKQTVAALDKPTRQSLVERERELADATPNPNGSITRSPAGEIRIPLRYANPSSVATALGTIVVTNAVAVETRGARNIPALTLADAQKELKRLQELEVQKGDEAPPKVAIPLPVPQPEIQTAANAFSTFSLNVSDVSFKLAAASLEKGQLPEPGSIRSEEFINAFDYHDPEPSPGAPIAFATERARYPFAHNRDLLRFSLKTAAAGRQAGRPLNLVLLLDNSGSMERADRVRIIHEALQVLAKQLKPQDMLSVVTFSRTPRLWVDGLPGSRAGEVADGLSGLTPEGGTNLEEAMNLAYSTAARHYFANGINRVVLLTDGAANLGNVQPEALKQKVEANRKQGIALDCFGVGWEGYNDDLLEVLSRNGDGRYGFINSPEEAATDFVGQLAGALKVAASDVKVQVEFNPKRVTSYRQIGYAKHQLTKEQFRDNTVDAAEIAAQEAGNALYTVEVNPAGEGPIGTVRVRYKVPGTGNYREQEWAVPYAGNVVSLEQASPAMRLSATASAFSEWLATSPFAGEVTTDSLLRSLNGVPAIYGADQRPAKLEWMIRQAKSVSGK